MPGILNRSSSNPLPLRSRWRLSVRVVGCLGVLLAMALPGVLSGQTLTANGHSLPLTLSVHDELRLSISHDGATETSADHDWWLALVSSLPPPNNVLFYNGERWSNAEVPVYQRPPGELLPVEVLRISGIPEGSFTFYFGLEGNADGLLDLNALDYDSLNITVTGDGEFSPAACGAEQQLFDISPLDSDAYHEISPLGATNPSGHTFPTVHTYMMLTDNRLARTVYSPGRIQVYRINAIENLTAGGTDYALNFSPCEEVTAYFDHLSSIDSRMQALLDGKGNCQQYFAGAYEYRFCSFEVQINYEPGDVLGTAGGGSGGLVSAALDFGLRDTRIEPLYYANLQRLGNSDQRYVACPYDYFVAGDVRDELQIKLMNARQDAPVCGTVEVDVENTAQGRWYLAGTTDYGEEGHIALVPSSLAPETVGVLSIGNSSVGIDAYYFSFQETGRVNRRLSEITADGAVYCFDELRNRATTVMGSYQSLPGVLLLSMDDALSLRLERNTAISDCPADPDVQDLSSAAVSFER